jgi:nucleoside-diphosphate-sugar epimerase
MLMGRPQTFGKRYNLTGRQYHTDVGYVDTMASVLGVEADKVFIPAPVMDDLWDGRIQLEAGRPSPANVDIRMSDSERARAARDLQLHLLSRLIQRLAPHLHRWNRSVCFDIGALERDTGWQPEYSFRAMVEQTWDWFLATGRDRSSDFDFGFEDGLLAQLGRG